MTKDNEQQRQRDSTKSTQERELESCVLKCSTRELHNGGPPSAHCNEKVVSWATESWEQGIGLWSVYEELWSRANSSSQETETLMEVKSH